MTNFLDASQEQSGNFPDSGCKVRTTGAGWRVIELDFWAIPERRKPSWRVEMERTMGPRKFRREFLRDWDTAAGDAYYPEFQEIGRENYLATLDALPRGVILFRGFDFGIRRPACVWGAYSPIQDRTWVLREFMPHGLYTHAFRDCVMYLSGDLEWESLDPQAQAWIEVYRQRGCPDAPWFEAGLKWENFSGPEATYTQSNAARDPRDATSAAIFATGGILLLTQAGPVKARHEVLRRLLPFRGDGYPGVLFDEAGCPELLQAMNGALSFPAPTARNPIPDRPRKDGHFDNIVDAFTYALSALVPSVDRPLPRPTPVGQFLPRPLGDEHQDALGWYENRPSLREDERPAPLPPGYSNPELLARY